MHSRISIPLGLQQEFWEAFWEEFWEEQTQQGRWKRARLAQGGYCVWSSEECGTIQSLAREGRNCLDRNKRFKKIKKTKRRKIGNHCGPSGGNQEYWCRWKRQNAKWQSSAGWDGAPGTGRSCLLAFTYSSIFEAFWNVSDLQPTFLLLSAALEATRLSPHPPPEVTSVIHIQIKQPLGVKFFFFFFKWFKSWGIKKWFKGGGKGKEQPRMGVVGPHFCFNPTENGAQQEGAALFQRSRIQQDSPPCSLLDIWSQDGRGGKKNSFENTQKNSPSF